MMLENIVKKFTAGLVGLGMTAGLLAGNFTNYVLPTKGFSTEIVLVNNDVMHSYPNHSMLYTAYDIDGNVLSEVPDSRATGSRMKTSLSELFPSVNVDDIGLVKVTSSNKNDAWVIYSNGDQKAMVQAPTEGSSVVDNLHFENNLVYWNFLSNFAKVNDDDSVVRAVINPSGEEVYFDGIVNDYGFVMPNFGFGVSAASINMDDFFGGVVPSGATWMRIYSEDIQHTDFGDSVTPVNNLVGNTVFMKTNGESGGAYGNSEAFEELIIPHIADQTANPDLNKRYFWTGLVFNNPSDVFVNAVIQYYSKTGVHLDVDSSTPEIDDYSFVLDPFGKKVDLISNFGMPEGAEFARVVAEKPIMGGELFGGEPSGTANWPIMAGVGLLLPGTGGYLDSVTDMNTPTLRYHLPLAESRAFTDTEEGLWTGVAFANLGKRNQTVVLEYKTDSGLVIGTQNYTVNSMSKQAITVEDLLKLGGLEDIREQVAMIDVLAKESVAGFTANYEVNLYALQGGKAAGTGTHSWMVGEDAVNKSPIDVKMFVANQTRGIVDGLEDMLGSMNIKVEDNDVILSHVISRLRDTKFGEVTGYDIVAYDNDWNEVGHLGGERFGASDKPYYVNHSSSRSVDSDTCPYGTFQLGVIVYSRINGVGLDWTYRIPDKTITRSPEQDYDIDAIKGEGFSYEKSQSNLELLTELVSSDDVVWQDGQHYTYDGNFPYLQKLFDGVVGDGSFEAVKIWIEDIKGHPTYGNAGALHIERTDGQSSGYAESFFTSSENTVEKWKQLYEVQNQN